MSVLTEADRAELNVLCWALVSAIHDHRNGGCDVCAAGYPPCPRVTAAVQVVVDWRDLRVLLTRAEYLRSGQELQDFAAWLGFTPAEVASLQAKWAKEERTAA